MCSTMADEMEGRVKKNYRKSSQRFKGSQGIKLEIKSPKGNKKNEGQDRRRKKFSWLLYKSQRREKRPKEREGS